VNLDLLLTNLLAPPTLFFALGIVARLLRSDLEIPHPIPRLFSLYLLWAIGFKGGVKLREAGLSVDTLLPLGVAVLFSLLTPVWVAPVLRRFLKDADACAVAAAYGSVSAVTFITATNFLSAQNIPFGGHMVAALALMEAPAIIVGVLAYRVLSRDPEAHDDAKTGTAALAREAFLSGPVFLLLGSLLAGLLTGPKGFVQLQPFTEDVFYGVLVLFLLDSGMTAANRLGELRKVGLVAVAAGIVIPLINAALAIFAAWAIGMPEGDAFLLTILAASASYIAVPAAMHLAIPRASPGIYMPMALGVTFPFNIAIGIPLYLAATDLVIGRPPAA
jgi:hypothetical protein